MFFRTRHVVPLANEACRTKPLKQRGRHHGFSCEEILPPAPLLNGVDYDAAPGDKCPGLFFLHAWWGQKFGFTRLFAVTANRPAAGITCEGRVPHSFGQRHPPGRS